VPGARAWGLRAHQRRQVVPAGKRHHVPVLAVPVGVARGRGNGLAGRLVGIDPLPLEGDLGRVVADEDVIAGDLKIGIGSNPYCFGGGAVGPLGLQLAGAVASGRVVLLGGTVVSISVT
jgi:hypothetical protein